jgi:hypothetical protein
MVSRPWVRRRHPEASTLRSADQFDPQFCVLIVDVERLVVSEREHRDCWFASRHWSVSAWGWARPSSAPSRGRPRRGRQRQRLRLPLRRPHQRHRPRWHGVVRAGVCRVEVVGWTGAIVLFALAVGLESPFVSALSSGVALLTWGLRRRRMGVRADGGYRQRLRGRRDRPSSVDCRRVSKALRSSRRDVRVVRWLVAIVAASMVGHWVAEMIGR